MRDRVVVVGAGICGMSLAAELARKLPTTLIDRLPVIGGITAGFEHPMAIELAKDCRTRRVELLLGNTALRWRKGELLLVGPVDGTRWLGAKHLVYAGGSRPSTTAELRLAGDRVAGVFPATVAYHLIKGGVRLGHTPLVIGEGRWAARICNSLTHQGIRSTIVIPDEASGRPSFGDTCWVGWSPRSLHGRVRITALRVERNGVQQTISCDAIVLAGALRPMRNVDGAIFDEAETNAVTFAQLPDETATFDDLREHGRSMAKKVLQKLEKEAV